MNNRAREEKEKPGACALGYRIAVQNLDDFELTRPMTVLI
jgi:hypothetical protein